MTEPAFIIKVNKTEDFFNKKVPTSQYVLDRLIKREWSKPMYKIKSTDRKFLKDKGFFFSPEYSNMEESYYIMKFPVIKCGISTAIECELIVRSSDRNVDVNIYDIFGKSYAPWYSDRYCTNNKNVEHINKKLKKIFKKLEIKDKNEYDKDK